MYDRTKIVRIDNNKFNSNVPSASPGAIECLLNGKQHDLALGVGKIDEVKMDKDYDGNTLIYPLDKECKIVEYINKLINERRLDIKRLQYIKQEIMNSESENDRLEIEIKIETKDFNFKGDC